jgi:hypothetical protein
MPMKLPHKPLVGMTNLDLPLRGLQIPVGPVLSIGRILNRGQIILLCIPSICTVRRNENTLKEVFTAAGKRKMKNHCYRQEVRKT